MIRTMCVAQQVINSDANERGKLSLEGGKASHEITSAAPRSFSEQFARTQLSDQQQVG